MTRPHPAHDAVAALTRQHRMTIQITPTVRYTVTAPCLLAQLADAIGVGVEHTGSPAVATSKPPISVDALDLWAEIHTSTHTWADTLPVDRRRYLNPADGHPIPPVGRLLRLVTATATGRGQAEIADAIHTAATRWRAQIAAMLHGVQQQRGVRGAQCPTCSATTIVETRPQEVIPGRAGSGRYRVPAIVLVRREVAGEPLRWLACLACGWSTPAGDDTAARLNQVVVAPGGGGL